ncbi:MAG: halocarboxylic acid dehydrogenase DehI family protein [Burkholderiaceae bacterium]
MTEAAQPWYSHTMTTHADPIPAINEVDATGEQATLFEDIRQSLGVPVVNLIFRHLATFPNVLPWCWQSLKPIYLDGTIGVQAHALRNALSLPSVAAISEATLGDTGIARADLNSIRMILRSYERSNAMNMIAFGALRARLCGDGHQSLPLVRPDGEQQAALTGTMPKPLAVAEMNEHTRALVLQLATIGGDHPIMPTMYRHLAHWPQYLGLLSDRLAPLNESRALALAIDSVMVDTQSLGLQIIGGLGQPAMALDASAKAILIQTIDTFQRCVIGKMIVIVGVIKQAMPVEN